MLIIKAEELQGVTIVIILEGVEIEETTLTITEVIRIGVMKAIGAEIIIKIEGIIVIMTKETEILPM